MTTEWQVGDVVDGRYRVTFVHEHGGMGLVYRVRHLGWDTDLAVKCPRPELFWDDADREQFVDEARAWMSLGVHPNVCCCHYVRTDDGVPRVFAEYVPGGSLREWIVDRRLYAGDDALARILTIAVQVAWGLGHAHERGLVHQDVKPANVLLDLDGTAKLTDFGLARAKGVVTSGRPDARAGATMLVSAVGMTEAYASPEQVARGLVSRRTDIYSFGVSVLEMFTGAVVWASGPTAGEALWALREDDLPGPAVPSQLAELLDRCLAVHPADRPRSMTEIAEELVGSYEAETGRPFPLTAPVAADLRADELNNRALSLLDLDEPQQAHEAFVEAKQADPQHLEATYNEALWRWRRGAVTDETVVAELEAVRASHGDSRRARHLLGLVHLERGDLELARPLLEDTSPDGENEPELRAARDVLTGGRLADAHCLEIVQVPWREDPPELALDRPPGVAIRFGRDGTRVLSGGRDGALRLWDTQDGTLLCTLTGHAGRVQAVDLSADGRTAISVGGDHTVRVWDLTTRRCVATFEVEPRDVDGVADYPVCLTPDGAVGLWAGAGNRTNVVDLRGGELLHTLRPTRLSLATSLALTEEDVPDGRETRLAVSADGRLAMTSYGQVWELATGRCHRRLVGFGVSLLGGSRLCLSADGRFALASGFSADTTIQLWNVETGECGWELPTPTAVRALALSTDGRAALSGSADGTVRFWDLAGGRCLRTFHGHTDEVSALFLDRDGTWALSAGQDGTLRRWALPRPGYLAPPRLARPRAHAELTTLHARAENLVADAERALSDGRYPDALELLSAARSMPSHERDPRVLTAWRLLGRHATRVGLRAAWQTASLGEWYDDENPELSTSAMATVSIDLSADGRTAMTADGRTVAIWDAGSGARVVAFTCAENLQVGAARMSGDGRHVVTANYDGTVVLWDASSGARRFVLETDPMVRSLRFSGDGSRVVSGGWDGMIRVWRVDEGSRIRTIRESDSGIDSLWVSDDGRLAATASGGGELPAPFVPDEARVRLWDLDSGECVLTMAGHTGPVSSVCLSQDGRVAVSGSASDGTIRLWDTRTGTCPRVLDTGRSTPEGPLCVRFSPDGRFVLAGHADATIRIWDVHSGRWVHTIAGHANAVADVEVAADGNVLLSQDSWDNQSQRGGSVRVWHLDWELR